MNLKDVKKIAVLGSGAMGHGIAQVCAAAGFEVTMRDIKQEFLDKGMAKIKESFGILSGKGKMTKEDADAALNRIKTAIDIKDTVKGAQIVIEAIPEVMELKKSIFKEVSDNVPEDTVLATNTSTMSITDIGSVIKNPSRFAGMHFFNPPNRMRLVEVIYGQKTSKETVDLLYEIAKIIKKAPVRVLKDRPGFIVNRINAPYQPLLSAILDEGKIKTDAIDAAQKKLGMPMGAFELLDYVGIDIVFHGMKYYEQTLSPEYKPGKYLNERMEKKELGMKTGKGIYDWSSGKAVIDMTQETTEISPVDFIAVLLNEAVKVFKEGIAESAQDIDQAQVAGMNSAAGPFALASGIEPAALTASLEKLSKRYGLAILKPEPEIADGSFKKMLKK